MTTPNDPLTLVYEALWELLDASSEFSRLVKLQNRIRFTDSARAPLKPTVTTGDLPEVRLIPVGLILQQGRTSSSTSIELIFELQCSSGDQRLDVVLLPLMWSIIRATSKWPTAMAGLTWNDAAFVVQSLLGDAQIGVSQGDLNRKIKGWSSLWQWKALVWFTTTDLQA